MLSLLDFPRPAARIKAPPKRKPVWRNGRRARFKIEFPTKCGFESRRRYLSFRAFSCRTGLQARSSAVRHVLGHAGACPSIADGKWRGTALRARVLLARRYSSFRAFSCRTGLQARSSAIRHAGTGLETRSTFSPTGQSFALTRGRPTTPLPLRFHSASTSSIRPRTSLRASSRVTPSARSPSEFQGTGYPKFQGTGYPNIEILSNYPPVKRPLGKFMSLVVQNLRM